MGSIENAENEDCASYPHDLGKLHRKISTKSEAAQAWFDRGIIWTYGFCHDEAVACFEKAAEADPECAVAHWGIAYAAGPNYNFSWDFMSPDHMQGATERGLNELQKADGKVTSASDVEASLVRALRKRFEGELKERNRAYADAMEQVYQQYPNDVDVAVLYCDAQMNLSPWKLWDVWTGEPAAHTPKIRQTLEKILHDHPDHPGAIHLYIHLMEMSPTPEAALGPAKDLHTLVPDSGHLHHMISHITLQCGMWTETLSYNADAIRADTKYLDRVGAIRFYALYRAHNWHFQTYAAMQSGQKQAALDAVTGLENSIPQAFVQQMPDFVEPIFAMRSHVMVRFGMWEEILAMPLKDDFWSYTNAMMHYAKGTALAVLGKFEEAGKEKELIVVKDSRLLFNNTCPDLIEIAKAMLQGEIDYRQHSKFDNLKKAVELDDHLKYAEPWAWMHPPRHALGALLLESNKVEEAMEVYKLDLGYGDLPRALQHPKNVWALHGYDECLRKLGQENARVQQDLKDAMALTDTAIESSCACRK